MKLSHILPIFEDSRCNIKRHHPVGLIDVSYQRTSATITETLSTSHEISVVGDTEDDFTATFIVRGVEYIFEAYHDTTDEDPGETWVIGFSMGNSNAITGYRTPFSVLSGVLNCIKELIRHHPTIVQLVFSADANEPSRVSLYKALTTKAGAWLPGWISDNGNRGGIPNGSQHHFQIVKQAKNSTNYLMKRAS